MTETSINERKQLQLERLQSSLNRAYRNVPYHQSKFREIDLDPSSVESLNDMPKIPFMTREDMGRNYPYGLFAVPLRDIVRIHTAPGTTKNPSISGYTRHDVDIWRSIVAGALAVSGIKDSDILQIHLNSGLSNWGRDYQAGAEALGVGVIPHDVLSLAKNMMVLRDYRTTVLVTTPAYAKVLTEYMYSSGFNPTGLSLKTLILAGEAASIDERSFLEKHLHVKTWQHYGLSEMPGACIACECAEKNGLHIQDEHFIAEIIDPKTMTESPHGEWGELVLTTLTARAFPLIRFRTGDLARLITEPCDCGSVDTKIEWKGDRTDDLLNIDGVKVSTSLVRTYLEEMLGFEPEFCEISRSETDESLLSVSMTVSERMFSDEIKLLEKTVLQLETKIQESVGVRTSFSLREKVFYI
ncbi:phenylacetate--CoA ligase family protein [Desulforegula conservatrix]|uniref:phenylacetate--CoA ligase family protein n=1 Tax=Desulforegula conservatrix TaxID=153026 RepID=UPI00040B552C|nr:AMP-binding protein [Desulforegula conservatrix]